MNVDPDEKVAGVTMRDIRRVFRSVRPCAFSAGYLCDSLKLGLEQANALMSELLERGFIEPDQDPLGEENRFFELTLSGTALANARFGKRFSREVAATLIDAVRVRAADLNADEWMPLYVEEIRAFGSWLGSSTQLGDVDLAVRFERRYGNEHHLRLVKVSVERDGFHGSFFQRLCYDRIAARRRLKRRDGRISIHDIEELANVDVEGEQIFEAGAVARGNVIAMIAEQRD